MNIVYKLLYSEVINIKIGYVRGSENSHIYKAQMKFLKNMNVEKIYHEKDYSNIELNEMAEYVRSGDTVFIYSIAIIGKNIKTIIRFIIGMNKRDVRLFIKKEELDTSNTLGKYVIEIISAFHEIIGEREIVERSETPNEKGRIPRELSDLKVYMKLVEEKKMTVKEVCNKLNIGRTTYYRRCKQLEVNEGDISNEVV